MCYICKEGFDSQHLFAFVLENGFCLMCVVNDFSLQPINEEYAPSLNYFVGWSSLPAQV